MVVKDASRFWIVFDTCTRVPYYQDVHNLLALPNGYTIRYEYRQKHLSLDAVKAASNQEIVPSMVLLVYAQWQEHQKGDDAPAENTPSGEILWVPTRFSEMQLVPPQEGEHFFFDLKVLGYPKMDQNALMRILEPLARDHEVPFHKWVSLSDDLQSLSLLQRGEEDDNWQAIVDCLGSRPMQFEGDSFWRLKEPFYATTGRKLQTIYQEDKQIIEDKAEVRRVASLYDLFEGSACSLEAIIHCPASVTPNEGKENAEQRQLKIEYDEEGPLDIDSNSILDLRPHTGEFVRVRAKRSESLDERIGRLHFKTGPQSDQWPVGPECSIQFRVRKRRWKVALFLLIGAISIVIGAYAKTLLESKPFLGGLLIFLSVLLIVIAFLLHKGTISLKP